MSRWLRQLDLRWNTWLATKPTAEADKRPVPNEDTGLTAWCQETAQGLGLPELARRVRVSWNARMQTTAGRAWWPDRLI